MQLDERYQLVMDAQRDHLCVAFFSSVKWGIMIKGYVEIKPIASHPHP